MLKNFLSSICAGVLISIGGCVFLACENRYVGSVLFSVALLCICLKGYALYTGRVGYIIESHKKSDFAALAVILIGNLITTFLLGMLVRVSIPQRRDGNCNLLRQAHPSVLADPCPRIFLRNTDVSRGKHIQREEHRFGYSLLRAGVYSKRL